MLELMVAIGVFILLATILVGLLQGGLTTWDSGTARKDVYERAQAVFTVLTRDLSSLYAPPSADANDPVYPMLGDADADGLQRLRFVRIEVGGPGGGGPAPPPAAGPGGTAGAPGAAPAGLRQGRVAVGGQGGVPALREIAYACDPDPARMILHRVEFPWGVANGPTVFDDRAFGLRNFLAANGVPVDTGLLFFELRYWTRDTTSWDGRRPAKGGSRNAGPEIRWDSTRQVDEAFAYHRRQPKDEPLDSVFPELVRVTIVLEPQVGERASTLLSTKIDDQASEIPVASTRHLSDPPGFVKIEKEWMAYRVKNPGSLTVQRGARGTQPRPHPGGAIVHSGVTFTSVIAVPMYREGKN